MTLDTNSTVWTFLSWGRPFQLISPMLDCSSPETTPIQIDCSKQFSAVLTKSGDVYAWWPSGNTLQDVYSKIMLKLDKNRSQVTVPAGGTAIPCQTWEINMDPVKLPILPNLPDLPATGLSEEECRKETKLIKIAALYGSIVGLTNKGHVLKINGLDKENSIGTWCYVSESVWMIWHPFLNYDAQLPNYSEIDKVKKHPAFHMTTGDDDQEKPPQAELSSNTMLITHVDCITSMNSKLCLRFPNI